MDRPVSEPAAVTVRPARRDEADEIAQLSRRQIERGLSWRWNRAAIAAQIAAPETEVVVARRGAALIGFAIAQFAFPDRCVHLVLLAVQVAERRRGHGRALLAWHEKMARVDGIERLQLELRADNRGARSFYEHLGFQATRRVRGYYEGRIDAIVMEKRLQG